MELSARSESEIRVYTERKSCPVTVIILTFNEEIHIRRAVQNVCGWATGVFILDSNSEDRTREIAKKEGATIFVNAFDNYAAQREWALRQLPFQTEWILFLDADELVSDDLKRELTDVLSTADNTIDGYYLNRRFYWMDKWLRYGGMYPSWILRVVRHQRARCNDRMVNEHLEVDGETRKLNGVLNHVDLSSITDWISKHNRYASLEALEHLKVYDSDENDRLAKLTGTQPERKRWIRKNIWNPLIPSLVRPYVYFIYVYIIRLGILDGKAGFIYHVLHGFCYRFMIETKFCRLRSCKAESTNSIQVP